MGSNLVFEKKRLSAVITSHRLFVEMYSIQMVSQPSSIHVFPADIARDRGLRIHFLWFLESCLNIRDWVVFILQNYPDAFFRQINFKVVYVSLMRY